MIELRWSILKWWLEGGRVSGGLSFFFLFFFLWISMELSSALCWLQAMPSENPRIRESENLSRREGLVEVRVG